MTATIVTAYVPIPGHPRPEAVRSRPLTRLGLVGPLHRCSERETGGPEAAVSQYCRGGFSKYLRPFTRGVTQSPVTYISRAISA